MRPTDADLLGQDWYAVPNDLIGGWAVATVDKPCSEHNHDAGEVAAGDFMTEAIARHVADLHNELRLQHLLEGLLDGPDRRGGL